MKTVALIALLLAAQHLQAQDDDCNERRMAKNGGWGKTSITNRAKAADYAIQKRFHDAAHGLFGRYVPRGTQPFVTGYFGTTRNNQPVADYNYGVYGMYYACDGAALKLQGETHTTLDFQFNRFFSTDFFEAYTGDNVLGFDFLSQGVPKEISPGVWRFEEVLTPLGFGLEGLTKLYLFTYPGQLPWQYVTRREFLEKRKRFVQQEFEETKKRTQDDIDNWDVMKKEKEKEYANDPQKMANFMSGYYNPGLAEAKARRPKLLGQYEASLQRLDEQLQAPAAELNQPAIVTSSTKNHLDWDFTEWEPSRGLVLIKPNPSYFKKGTAPAVPQVMTFAVKYYQKDPVSSNFAEQMEKLADLPYLQSFIGKTAPPASGNSKLAQTNNTTTPVTATPAVSNNPSTNRSTATPTANRITTRPNNTKSGTTNNPSTTNTTNNTGKGIVLSGTLSAPAGVPVTLSYNGANDLTVTPPKGKDNLYNSTSFQFTKPLKAEEAYSVVLKKIASNMNGVIYQGSGKATNDMPKVKIGVDFKYELISRDENQTISNFFETGDVAVGGMGGEEGRYVAFVSWAKGFAGNDARFRQVFWKDRNTGRTLLISKAPDGSLANANCALPSISADGQIVVFETRANNLVPGDDNKVRDIFLWRASTGKVELASIPAAGGWSNGESYEPSVSGNGKFVVFTSDAANMTPTPQGRSSSNIFLRSLAEGKTEMLSIEPTTQTGGNAEKASISFDGSRVSFCSPTPTLVANDNNKMWDIFLWEKGKKELRRISMTHDGKERNQGQESASRSVWSTLSGDGRYVVYSTTATNMVPGENLQYQDVFVYDIENNKLQVASFTEAGQPGNHDSPIDQGDRMAISYDGTWVVFPTKATNLGAQNASNLALYNTRTGKKKMITDTRGSYISRPAISYSGSYVVFSKNAGLDIRSGVAIGDDGGGIFAHFTGNGPCRDCKE